MEAVVALIVFVALGEWLTRDVVRGPMPSLDGTLLDGTPVAQWQGSARGRAHLVYVWATWCGICKAMQGNVDAVAADSALVTIAMQSGGDEQVWTFLAARGQFWPTLNDPQGGASRGLGVSSVPMLLFVDRRGEIRSVTRGYTSEAGIRARLWWVDRGP